MTIHMVFGLAGLAALAGCGGTSLPEMTPIDAFTARARDAVAVADGVSAASPTAFSAMPVSGKATFTGVAALSIDPVAATDADDIVLLGDATLTADFDKSRLTGSVGNFTGATRFTATSASVIPVSGSLKIGSVESVIGNDVDDNRTDHANELFADYRGTIGLPDGHYSVNGRLNGQFRGTRTAAGAFPIKGLTAAGDGVLAKGTEGTAGFRELPASLEIAATAPR